MSWPLAIVMVCGLVLTTSPLWMPGLVIAIATWKGWAVEYQQGGDDE